MKIRTKYKTNANGGGQILATGGGRQKTIGYDPRYSSDTNHGHAAGLLALKLVAAESPGTAEELEQRFNAAAAQPWQHDSSEDGCTHTFTV